MLKWFASKKPSVFLVLVPIYIGLLLLFALLIRQGNVQLLEPAGYIAEIQSHILWGALIFAGIVGSTIILSFFFVVARYSETKHRIYQPHWDASKKLVAIAWGVPLLVILVISVLVWTTAHQVDPFKALPGNTRPIKIQVVALQWKWLFIYPDDNIATINKLEIPVGTPISLELTADAPMNSFWIPRLSGQIYAMSGMVTKLHIEAAKTGAFVGSPAEMSGDDFAGMDFAVNVVSDHDYAAWKATARRTGQPLTYTSFLQLARPSGYNSQVLYSVRDHNLFDAIVMQYMVPGTDPSRLSIKGESI